MTEELERKVDPSFALFGGPLDTGNLGVSALGSSILEGLAEHCPRSKTTVFDNGWGQRHGTLIAGERSLDYGCYGGRLSRRYYRPEALQTMYTMARLRGLGNPGVRLIQAATAVFDVSGGDSFTDMYGQKVFRAIMMPKMIAIRVGTPLILLPQTYGPYYADGAKERASWALRRAHSAWARDAESYEQMKSMLGDDHDEARHRLGVDMAFGLTPTEPHGHDELKAWLHKTGPVVGVNVSGLLMHGPPAGMTVDALRVDYGMLMTKMVQRLLSETDARVLFVPHVLTRGPARESDESAIVDLLQDIDVSPDRVRTVPTEQMTANEAKFWVGKCDWFCGTRMHSTIAALSSGVPAAAVAYSLKTRPVFETVNQEEHVVDARTLTTEEALERLWHSWEARSSSALSLKDSLPAAKRMVTEQTAAIVASALDHTESVS